MTPSRTIHALTCVAVAGLASGIIGFAQDGDPSVYVSAGDWRQWGGPHRNFVSDAKGLTDAWPADGAPRYDGAARWGWGLV